MHALPIFVRMAGRRCILVGAGEGADAKRRLLQRAGAVIVDVDAAASLAIVALDDDAAAEAAVARLRRRGILVNAVDRPALCDFTLPAVVDRDPVIVAIGSDGRSAGLAKALRQRLETLLPADIGARADRLFALRPRLRARYPGARARREAIDNALAPGGPLDVLGPATVGDEWLEVEEQPAAGPRIERLRLRSPDPDELTLREARLLGAADRICHRADVPAAILNRARADADRVAGDAADLPAVAGLTIDLAMLG